MTLAVTLAIHQWMTGCWWWIMNWKGSSSVPVLRFYCGICLWRLRKITNHSEDSQCSGQSVKAWEHLLTQVCIASRHMSRNISMQQGPTGAANSYPATQKISTFMECGSSLPHRQLPTLSQTNPVHTYTQNSNLIQDMSAFFLVLTCSLFAVIFLWLL